MKKSKVCKYCGEKLEITSDRCLACGKTQKFHQEKPRIYRVYYNFNINIDFNRNYIDKYKL